MGYDIAFGEVEPILKESIFIPFSEPGTIGGPQTFMNNLKVFLDKTGYGYSKAKDSSNGIFFPISCSGKVLNYYKRNGLPVIQRLDGIYYPSKHGRKTKRLNKPIKKVYLDYATHVIFQSKHSRDQCFEIFGEKHPDCYSLIVNGVNKDIFYPSKEVRSSVKGVLKFITTGNLRNIDMIEPVIKALDLLHDRKKCSFELNIVGPIANRKIKDILDRDYVNLLGTKKSPEVAAILRDSDIFIYSHLNPPCSNSVIEAISCGLPVVGFDSGSMSELCYFSKDLLAFVSDDVLQKYSDFDYKKLYEKIDLCISRFEHFKGLAMQHAHLYDFNECGSQYVEVFKGCLESTEEKLPTSILSKIKAFLLPNN